MIYTAVALNIFFAVVNLSFAFFGSSGIVGLLIGLFNLFAAAAVIYMYQLEQR